MLADSDTMVALAAGLAADPSDDVPLPRCERRSTPIAGLAEVVLSGPAATALRALPPPLDVPPSTP